MEKNYSLILAVTILPIIAASDVTAEVSGSSETNELGIVRTGEEFLPVKVAVERDLDFDPKIAHRYLLDLQEIFSANAASINDYQSLENPEGERRLLVAYKIRAQMHYYPRLHRDADGTFISLDDEEYERYKESYITYSENREIYDRIDDDLQDVNRSLLRDEWDEKFLQKAAANFFWKKETIDRAEESLSRLRNLQIRNSWLIRSYFFAEETNSHMALTVAHKTGCAQDVRKPVMVNFSEDLEEWRLFLPDLN